jgi:hypothetical protein
MHQTAPHPLPEDLSRPKLDTVMGERVYRSRFTMPRPSAEAFVFLAQPQYFGWLGPLHPHI